MSDFRDYARSNRWWVMVDEICMKAKVDFGDGDEVWVPIRFDVCESCYGKGRYVNPNIDRGGLTAEDFDESGIDFLEGYMAGDYDITCEECEGRRVTPVFAGDHAMGKRIEALVADRHAAQAELEAEMRFCYGPN